MRFQTLSEPGFNNLPEKEIFELCSTKYFIEFIAQSIQYLVERSPHVLNILVNIYLFRLGIFNRLNTCSPRSFDERNYLASLYLLTLLLKYQCSFNMLRCCISILVKRFVQHDPECKLLKRYLLCFQRKVLCTKQLSDLLSCPFEILRSLHFCKHCYDFCKSLFYELWHVRFLAC